MKRDGDGMHHARAKRRWLGAASVVALLTGAGPAWADNCFTASGNPFLVGFANGTFKQTHCGTENGFTIQSLGAQASLTSPFLHDGCRHRERQCRPGAGLVPGQSRDQCRTASRASSDYGLQSQEGIASDLSRSFTRRAHHHPIEHRRICRECGHDQWRIPYRTARQRISIRRGADSGDKRDFDHPHCFSGPTAGIVNSGLMELSSGRRIRPANKFGPFAVTGITLNGSTLTGNITNSGTIMVTATAASNGVSAKGVVLGGGPDFGARSGR